MKIFDDDRLWFDIEYPLCEDCDHNECFGQAPNPLATPSLLCKCGHDKYAHWKGKKCRAYACWCSKYEEDDN